MYVVTEKGERLSLLDPDPRLIDLRDVAARLARIRRFAGMDAKGWTVAHHTLLAAALAPEHARAHVLLHDAHEAFLGDWITPVKQAVLSIGGADALAPFREVEQRISAAIHVAAGLPFARSEPIALAVEVADLRAYQIEVDWLIPSHQARQFARIEVAPTPQWLRQTAVKGLVDAIFAENATAALQDAFAAHFGVTTPC